MAYWAPDLFDDTQESRLDLRRDIWCLGITLVEALLGRLPYLDAKDPVPEGYETIKYLNKIDEDKGAHHTFPKGGGRGVSPPPN